MKLRDRLMHRIDMSLRDKGIYDLSFDELTKRNGSMSMIISSGLSCRYFHLRL